MEESRASGHAGHAHPADVSPDGIWLSATWPFVRGQLPPPPARVIELGCGPAGGHGPALIRAGYDATGVDPEAPAGPGYVRTAFEEYRPPGPADAIVASVSLHHVGDPGVALDHVAEVLRPGGVLVVVEWISEGFDEATARWCFGHRLRDQAEPGAWLGGMSAGWAESGLGWDHFFRGWLDEHGLHAATAIRRELDARFAVTHLSTGPYYFPDLADAGPDAEQAAIDAGQIRAGCLRYAGAGPVTTRARTSQLGRGSGPVVVGLVHQVQFGSLLGGGHFCRSLAHPRQEQRRDRRDGHRGPADPDRRG
jgi:SAM-dependent methyltransferase